MIGRLFIRRLAADRRGAAVIEFAFLAPMMIVMMLGVVQVGIGLQNYNALRNLSADMARFAMVQYASGNHLTNEQLKTFTESAGQGAPYLLAKTKLHATITDAATQRVTGAKELSMTVTYQIPSLVDSMGLSGPEISYTRPIFLTNT